MGYADDIAIFASSQRSAERILESVVKWLGKELKLEVNRTKSGAGPTEQSGLLGFRRDEEGTIEIGDLSGSNESKNGYTNSGTCATKQDQSAAESTVAKLHQRVVELLPTGRKARGDGKHYSAWG